MTRCPYNFWTFLPLELRRRLRVVYAGRSVPEGRLRHLADHPRCGCVREDAA